MPPRLTTRDLDIFAALERSPLTAVQLLKLSQSFALPFTNEHCVRERLHLLAASGRVHRWQYSTAGPGALNYYTLSKLGYQLLLDHDAPAPAKRAFSPVGLARQPHTLALGDFIVHTAVLAHEAGIRFDGFCRENAVCLEVDEESVCPDCAFQLLPPDGREFSFFVELDNSTERVYSTKHVESWERKLRVYERYQRRCGRRFRVLIVTTRNSNRLDQLLVAARRTMPQDRRSLFYGVHLDHYLEQTDGLRTACFRDHLGRPQSLVPATPMTRANAPSLALHAQAC